MKQFPFILILIILIIGSHAYHLPIIQKYRKLPHIIKQIDDKPIQKAMTSIVVAHGATDIFTKPIDKVYANYFNSFVLLCSLWRLFQFRIQRVRRDLARK